ncbi:ABC transporter ATP-binding protein [Poriferisphaera sp. WC338]|uniref:ABC transporter ATP-binding protein n=1 Tax=Poriferisphaera sp. WC338 TaxID=3425129 RepID=UPI003D8168D3
MNPKNIPTKPKSQDTNAAIDLPQNPSAQTAKLNKDYSNKELMIRMLALAWQYKRGLFSLLAIQLLLLGLIISALNLTGLAIDVIHRGFNPEAKTPEWPFGYQPPVDSSPLQLILIVGGIIFTFAALRFVLERILTVWKAVFVQTMVIDLRTKVYNKLQRLTFRFFDDNESASIINRVTSDVQGLRTFVDTVLLEVLGIIISLIIYISYMLQIHVGLTIACLATTPLIWLTVIFFSRIIRPAFLKNRKLFDSAVRVISENAQGVHVVKGFGLQPNQAATFAAANDKVTAQKNWTFNRLSTFVPLVSFIATINIPILLVYGGYLFIHDPKFNLGSGLIVFATLLTQVAMQIGNIANITNGMMRSLTAAQRVFEIQDAPIEIKSPSNAISLPRARGELVCHNVSFAYSQDSPPVIQNISFTASAGSCIALLGATGSGKSSLLSLIPRFYDPTAGHITLDGHKLTDLTLDDLRRNIGIVFQETYLFSVSIADNIAFGNPTATRDQIVAAAKIAHAHEFIEELEHGYDTLLREAGQNLSGGQRQRIAIARAVLLDPPILLLDDPTAAVDPETEHLILSAMDNAMSQRTTFVIAHRLSTLQRADMILVLENGHIVETGTHEELMQADGHYYEAAKLQIADDHSREILGLAPIASTTKSHLDSEATDIDPPYAQESDAASAEGGDV